MMPDIIIHAIYIILISTNGFIVYIQCFNPTNSFIMKKCDGSNGACSEIMFGPASRIYDVPISIYSFSAITSIYVSAVILAHGFSFFVIAVHGLLTLISCLLFISQIIAKKYCHICNIFNALNLLTFIIVLIIQEKLSPFSYTQIAGYVTVFSVTFASLWLAWRAYCEILELDEERSLWESIVRYEDPLNLNILRRGTEIQPTFGASFHISRPHGAYRSITVCLSLDCWHCMETLQSLIYKRGILARQPVNLTVYFTCHKISDPKYFSLLSELKNMEECTESDFINKVAPRILNHSHIQLNEKDQNQEHIQSLMSHFEQAANDDNEPDFFPAMIVDGRLLPERYNDVDFWMSILFPAHPDHW